MTLNAFACKMQPLHPTLMESPPVLHPGCSVSGLEKALISRNGAGEVTLDKSPLKSHPPSFLSYSFLSDRPQFIQHQGVLFKFQVNFLAETPSPQLSQDVESELWQVLQITLHCILTESDPPDLIRTERLCVRPQLKFWPLSQQLSCLQEGEGVIPCDRMIELQVTECSPHMAPPVVAAAAAAESGNESCAYDCSDPYNVGSSPPQQQKESSARVRFRSHSSFESMELKEKKTRKSRKKGKRKYSLHTKHSPCIVRNSALEPSKKMIPREMDSDDNEKEVEKSPLRGITDKFSHLTFFSPDVKRLRKRKPPKRSPTQSRGCRSPRPKIPRGACVLQKMSPCCTVPQAGKSCELLQLCHSDYAVPQSGQQLKVRNATAEASVEETSTQDSLQSTSFGEYVTDASEETEDDAMKHIARSSPTVHKSSFKTRVKMKKAPICKLSQVHGAAGDDTCGQKRQNLLVWLSEDSPLLPCSQKHGHLEAGIQQVPTAHGDHHSSYTRHRESTLRRWLADSTDWNFKPRCSRENIPDGYVFNDSDAPDVEVCTPPFLTDGSSQADSNQHPLSIGQPPRDEGYDEASIIEVCCPSPIKDNDSAATKHNEGKGSKHAMSSPEEMPLKRFCRHIPAKDNSLMQNTTQAGQAESSRCDKSSRLSKPRIPKGRKSFLFSRGSSSAESSESATTTEETSLSPGSTPLSGSTDSEPTLSSTDGGSSSNACTSPTTTNTSPDSASQVHVTRRSTKSKRVTFKTKYSRRSPKTQALGGETKKSIDKMNNSPFWAKANISKSRKRGMEYMQTQIKHFVKTMPTESDEQPRKRNKVQFESQGDFPLPGDVQMLHEKRTTAARPQKKKRLYTGNVLLAGDGSGEETLGKTLEQCTNNIQQPLSQSRFPVPCRPMESNNEVSHENPSGHHNSILCLDSDSGICNGNNCSSDSQDMHCGAADCGFDLERSDRQLEESMDV